MSQPRISVVVPSHDRPLRLRWFLNALEEQTLDRADFEVVVGHDSEDVGTADLLSEHPLAADGTLREVRFATRTESAGAHRNAAWRATAAATIVFTDDDCRPPADWLARALEVAADHPGEIVQGRTMPDPDEWALMRAPYRHTQNIFPPSGLAETCNIVYPRRVLEQHGGFDEILEIGEDSDLMLRARRAGTACVGDARMVTYHAVVPMSLPRRLRSCTRWKSMPDLVRRNPELRESFPLRTFWKRSHMWGSLAALGLGLGLIRRNPLLALLAVPWCVSTMPHYGSGVRGRLRALSELPASAVVDLTEFAVLAYGSARNRTIFL